jgi:hypothetical protein
MRGQGRERVEHEEQCVSYWQGYTSVKASVLHFVISFPEMVEPLRIHARRRPNSWNVSGSETGTARWIRLDGRESAPATVPYTGTRTINLTECLKLAAAQADPALPLTRTGASNSPRSRRPSANMNERPSVIRNATRDAFSCSFGRASVHGTGTFHRHRLVHDPYYHMRSASLEPPRFPELWLRVRLARQ